MVSYNLIDSNNIENLPNLGGSGIAFTGGSATSHQNSIVTGNIFRANLYGITIQNFAKPNIGNITNVDTTDDGKNLFINNVNTTYTTGNELFNNSPDTIYAQNNYWNVEDSIGIETKISHKPDNATYGLVIFSGYMTIPVELVKFVALQRNGTTTLSWQTASENNSDRFEVEKSSDGRSFNYLGTVNAAGNSSSARNYSFADNNAFITNNTVFYRFKTCRQGRSL